MTDGSLVGRTISHYRILERLGRGGMGVVYKAEDTRLRRPVALKFLLQGPVDEELKKRFLREAQAVAQLNHPNICPVYDIGEAEGRIFFAMAFLNGRTVGKMLRSGPIDLAQAVDIATQVASGLEEAHTQDIVHRDISTGNVMVNDKGHVSILDFGLALVRGESRLTKTGSTLGTAAYMSPEQAQGEPVDHRTDIWSLGTVLFEMVAGRLPFDAEHELATLYGVVNEPTPSLTELRPGAPSELQAVIERTLAKRPGDRYSTAGELVSDLQRVKRVLERTAGVQAGETLIERGSDHGKPQSADSETGVGAPTRRLATKLRQWNSALQSVERPIWLTSTAVMITVLVLLGAWVFVSDEAPKSPLPGGKHVAVLPFETIGDDPETRALSDGLVEVLASKLSQIEQFQGELLVVPTSEIRNRSVTSVEQARKVYGVNLAITGSFQTWGDELHLTANLVDANTLRQVGSTAFEAPLMDLRSLRVGVISRVVRLLELELTPAARESLSAPDTDRPEAYRAYLQGRGYLQRFDVEGNIDRAIRSFEQATEQDPDYALAYAGLAEAYWEKAERNNDRDLVQQALMMARRAIGEDSTLATARVKLGEIYRHLGQNGDAIREFESALELNPANAEAHTGLARVYLAMGNTASAEAAYLRAVDLRPTDWRGYNALGVFYYRQGRYREALSAFRTATELTPDNDINYKNLGGVYLTMGRFNDARIALEKSLAIEPSARAYENLGEVYFFEGSCKQAVSAFETAIELQPNHYRLWGALAKAFSCTGGSKAAAETAFRRAIELAQERLAIAPNDYSARNLIAQYWAQLNNPEKALDHLGQIPDPEKQNFELQLQMALSYILLGRTDQAVKRVESVLQNGFPIANVLSDPALAQLRNSPSFARIAERFKRGN